MKTIEEIRDLMVGKSVITDVNVNEYLSQVLANI